MQIFAVKNFATLLQCGSNNEAVVKGELMRYTDSYSFDNRFRRDVSNEKIALELKNVFNEFLFRTVKFFLETNIRKLFQNLN